jgi:hypothetical protein
VLTEVVSVEVALAEEASTEVFLVELCVEVIVVRPRVVAEAEVAWTDKEAVAEGAFSVVGAHGVAVEEAEKRLPEATWITSWTLTCLDTENVHTNIFLLVLTMIMKVNLDCTTNAR